MIYEIHIDTEDKELFEQELKALATKYNGIAMEGSALCDFSYDFRLPETISDHKHVLELPKHEHRYLGQRVL